MAYKVNLYFVLIYLLCQKSHMPSQDLRLFSMSENVEVTGGKSLEVIQEILQYAECPTMQYDTIPELTWEPASD